jgi:flavin-dependent dehydrogenase
MNNETAFDCAIIGGGIGGLCLGLQLARLGHSVILFEKYSYPFHKVCGEYVSNESRDFLKRIGLPLDEWDLPQIKRLGISSLKGYMLNAPLKLGGFGISRFRLDHELSLLARSAGVVLMENTRVTNVNESTVFTTKGEYQAKIILGTFGKSKPVFTAAKTEKKHENFIGVKYHIRTDFPSDRIELHNFYKGYCGISKVEAERFCLCYLSSATNLKEAGNSIPEMEQKVLKKNPYLKYIFENSDFLFDKPVTVSNISFAMRQTSDQQMIYLGDAAGCISPLTGNGMSMAAYSSVFLSRFVHEFLENKITKPQLKKQYDAVWKKLFFSRIKRGERLQYLFGKKAVSDLALRFLDPISFLKTGIVESTHGQPF